MLKKGCIILSSLSESQLRDLLLKINNLPLRFRRNLNLPSYISFGNEIEVNNLNLSSAEFVVELFNDVHDLKSNQRFVVKEDQTVDSEITSPILTDTEEQWELFRDMYEVLNGTGATIGENTSCHIHYGTHMINTPHKLSLLLKTLVVFEPIIFKFGYGEDMTARESIVYRDERVIFSPIMFPQRVRKFTDVLDNYKRSSPGVMSSCFKSFLTQDMHYRPVFNFNNFDFSKLQYEIEYDSPNKDDHLEVRCNNGTLKPEIAQNDINLVAHIIWAVNEGLMDEEYIEQEYAKYKKKKYNFDCPYMIIDSFEQGEKYNRLLAGFDKVRLDKAIKLADMVFITDIDKLYFLKQYLKLFSVKDDVVDRILSK